MTFASLGLIEPLLRALETLGYQTPTPVQAQAIPPVLEGRDLMAAAQTGTGKTAGFALPLLQRLTMEGPKVAANSVLAPGLVPTPQLADQVHDAPPQPADHLPPTTYGADGRVRLNLLMMKLRRGVDVLVATPGRLLDLYRQNAVKFSQLQTLILDEADRMLDLGFSEELRDIYAALPKRRQTLLFSATFSEAIRALAGQMLDNPLTIEVSPRNVAASSVKQWIVTVDKKRKSELFIHLLKKHRWGQVLVFAKTRVGVDQLVERLQGLSLNADGIHGDKPQATRQRALDRFKSGDVQILVATDVAARGLDIDDLPAGVNLDLPVGAEDYIHRNGRTGRAGPTGEASSLGGPARGDPRSAVAMPTRQTLQRREEPDFIPEHRVPATDATGQILKKPKKPKKPKTSGGGGKRNLGKWVDSGEAAAEVPAIKPVRKVPVFNTGPRKRKP